MAETKTETKKLTIEQKIFEIQKSAELIKSRKGKNYTYYNLNDMYELLIPMLEQHNLLITFDDSVEFGSSRAFVNTQLCIKDLDSGDILHFHSVSEAPEQAGAIAGSEKILKNAIMSDEQATKVSITFARKQCLENAFRITSPEVEVPNANHIPSNNRASEEYF